MSAAGMVVGIDGSPSSEAALRWATARTDQFGPITPVTETSDAGPALVRHGRQAEMIVVGCRGRRGALGAFQRSVSGHVASHATVPVAVVPMTGSNTSRRDRVLVGIDGSDNSVAALTWAIRTAPPHCHLEVVYVWQHGVNRLLDRRATVPSVRVELEAMEILDDTVVQARRAAGCSRRGIVTRLEYGEPRKVIRELSRDAELLVLGANGHRGGDRLFVGSVASGLIHRPLTTTIVIPPVNDPSASR